MSFDWWPLISFAVVAALYAAVGQAGGTGYIAVMALAGFAPDSIKPTALALNVLVAAIGCIQFYRAGLLTWRSCYPFAILGAPFSVLGGALNLPANIYQPVVGVMLVVAAIQVARSSRFSPLQTVSDPPFIPSLILGGVIGFASGITGVGGGIFLAPIVLMLAWTEVRQAGAISATFNLLNSAAAFAAVWATTTSLPSELPVWLLAVAAGGFLGSWIGANRLDPSTLRVLLAILLFAAGLRMIAGQFL